MEKDFKRWVTRVVDCVGDAWISGHANKDWTKVKKCCSSCSVGQTAVWQRSERRESWTKVAHFSCWCSKRIRLERKGKEDGRGKGRKEGDWEREGSKERRRRQKKEESWQRKERKEENERRKGVRKEAGRKGKRMTEREERKEERKGNEST